MIDPTHPVISIARQCELIQLPRASYYRAVDYGPVVETEENLNLMRLIDGVHFNALTCLPTTISVHLDYN